MLDNEKIASHFIFDEYSESDNFYVPVLLEKQKKQTFQEKNKLT